MKILVDPQYNPDLQEKVTSSTKLGVGITCAKFLGSRGSRTQFEKLRDESYKVRADHRQIARNLILHANAMLTVTTNPDFSQHRLIVSDGIYEPNPRFTQHEQKVENEILAKFLSSRIPGSTYGKTKDGKYYVRTSVYRGEVAGGFNKERRFGRGIGYQLIDKYGKTDPRKTFDLAVFWKDYIDYDKLELAYDTFDPNGELTTSILLTMPEVPSPFESYEVSFQYGLETTYNGELQAKNELLEILPD